MFPRVGVSIEGQGPAAVLLHSSMSSKSQWRKLVLDLRTRYRVIAIDLYGYGGTAWPRFPAEFCLDDEVNLVTSVLDQQLISGEEIHLVGHSYGGAVALHLAERFPEKVRSLSLFEPGSFHLLPPGDPARAELEALRNEVHASLKEGNPHRGAARFINYWSGTSAFGRLPARHQDALARLLPKTLLEFDAIARSPASASYWQMPVPTLLLSGRHSPQAGRNVNSVLADLLPHATSREIAGGHMAPVSHAELVNPHIAAFMRTCDFPQYKAA